MQFRNVKKVAIIHCDAPDQSIFSRGNRKNIHISELSRLAILHSNSKIKKGAKIEPIIHQPLLGEDFPKLDDLDAVIVPGSIHNPTFDAIQKMEWLKKLAEFMMKLHEAQRPLFGLCFGHQLLGAMFKVEPVKFDKKIGVEAGFHPVTLTPTGEKDPLFSGIPQTFQGAFFHYYYVPDLPEGAIHLANGENCKIQSFRMGETTWGVQFHPDYDAHNVKELVGLRLEALNKVLEGKPIDTTSSSEHNCQVFENFLTITRKS